MRGEKWPKADQAPALLRRTSWLIAETRTYLVPRPPGGYQAHSRYRLLVDRVPGRGSGGESHVAIRELQFTTAEALPAPCVGLESVAVGMNIMAGPPPSRSDPKPYYLITVLPGDPPALT